MSRSQKAEKGQFFTPRHVIDMCVKMMNPSENDFMIDTASGSCGFPMHTIFHVWNKMNPEKHNFVNTKRSQKEIDYVNNKVFAIDFDETCVRVGKMLNIIAGDGKTNVIELNTLDYNVWNGTKYLGKSGWKEKYYEGFSRFEELAKEKNKYQYYRFDLVLANPPFAGPRNDPKVLNLYELGKDKNGKVKNKIGRDILFIERNLNFLKPGGRMGIVLPQGDFNNPKEKYLRTYIAEKCRILAVVGLHENTFLQHAGPKTSVLFVQKWTDENCGFPNICPKPRADKDGNIDYPIFFATMQEPTINNQKEKIYVTENYVSWTKYSHAVKNGKLVTTAEPQLTGWKTTEFVKDLFVKDYGDIDTHKKWILEPVTFEKKSFGKKNKKELKSLKEKLTLDEYLAMEKDARKHYKKVLNNGNDCDTLHGEEIGLETYKTFSKEKKKYFIPVEDVKERNNVRVKDTHGHIFVKHDLFNHDKELDDKWASRDTRLRGRYSRDGIAEAFAEFAKKEKLSFFL